MLLVATHDRKTNEIEWGDMVIEHNGDTYNKKEKTFKICFGNTRQRERGR